METPTHILIAEDEPVIAKKIFDLTQELNWRPVVVGEIPALLEALSSAGKTHFELLILDRMMGGSDSADYVANLRVNYPTLRILILSAIDSSAEKARLIESGADDYLSKPFETNELKARLKALMRRAPMPLSKLTYEIANLSLDLIERRVFIEGKELNLTVKEFLVLNALSANIGKVFSKNQLIESIWGFSLENETNVVESTMNSLRRKLEQAHARVQIKNTRFVGYWLEV